MCIRFIKRGGTDTSDATATAGDLINPKTAYVDGQKITGTLVENGTYQKTVTDIYDSSQESRVYYRRNNLNPGVAIKTGNSIRLYSSYSTLANAIALTADKIKKDVTIIGVTGTYEGGSEIPDMLSFDDLMTQIANTENKFTTFLQNKLNSYPVYTENPITLYRPNFTQGSGYTLSSNYIIHKRSNGKYRIIWGNEKYAVVKDSTSVGFRSFYFIPSVSASINSTFKFEDINKFDLNTFATNNQVFMYSNEVDTIEELIQQISTPNNTLQYNEWANRGSDFTALLDSPYEITYTNMNVFDLRNNGNVLMSKRISKNETYEYRTS